MTFIEYINQELKKTPYPTHIPISEIIKWWGRYMEDKVIDIWTVTDVEELAKEDGVNISNLSGNEIRDILDYIESQSEGISWPAIKTCIEGYVNGNSI